MARGGKRKGAGRPKGSLNEATKEKQRYKDAFEKLLLQEVSKEQKPMISALIRKAKTGDVTALREVLERVLGKTPNIVKGDSEDGSIVFKVATYKGDK